MCNPRRKSWTTSYSVVLVIVKDIYVEEYILLVTDTFSEFRRLLRGENHKCETYYERGNTHPSWTLNKDYLHWFHYSIEKVLIQCILKVVRLLEREDDCNYFVRRYVIPTGCLFIWTSFWFLPNRENRVVNTEIHNEITNKIWSGICKNWLESGGSLLWRDKLHITSMECLIELRRESREDYNSK